MQQDDGRAFRPHLAGAGLLRAQERFVATLLRCPGLWANASRSNITSRHFPSSLRSLFDLATTAPQKIRDAMASGINPAIARLYHLPVQNGGVALSLGRQIVESIRRADKMARHAAAPADAPVPVEIRLVVPTSSTSDTPAEALGKDRVMTFLRDLLANGALPAREIERIAAREGLLAAGRGIGDAKPFRSARRALGIKPFQQPGQKSGGWIWALPCQAPSAASGRPLPACRAARFR